ncbi:MAG TPA: ABC transporter transmembrane domain-containing protein [Gemmatimonadaceae bacterium]|nr:ABC transporter transmembrane domain-containing protein [Gemmatimonadaceae bacterium]
MTAIGGTAEAVVEKAVEKKRTIPSPKPLGPLFARMRGYPGMLAVAAVTLVASVAAGLVFPLVVGDLLNAAFVDKSAARLNALTGWLILLFAVQAVFNFVQVWTLTTVTERVIARLRGDLFAHLVRLSPGFFSEKRSGELSSRLSADLTLLQSVLGYQLPELVRQVLYLVGGVVLLTYIHPQLTLTTLAVAPLIVGAAWMAGRLLRRSSTNVQDRVADAMGMADETFGHIRVVQSFTRESYETQRYVGLLADVVTAALRRAWIRGVFFGTITFVGFSGVAAVLWQGGRLVLQGQLTAGLLFQFLLLAFTVAAAIGALAQLFGQFQESVGAAQRVFELLQTQPAITDPPAPVPLPRPARGDVRFDRVSFRYAAEQPDVLHDVSFRIVPGEVVALVGASGAGKTTIASLIPRFWDVTRGTITLDRIDIRRLALDDLRGAIGIVPQEPVLFSGTVRENIAFARPDASDADIERAARAAHAMEFIEQLRDKMDTKVGERGVKLSGGQRQRIAIARVFLKDPAVVILDEATSSLDRESERLVEQAMEELLKGRSTLIISHRMDTVRRADRIVVLHQGRVVEEGPQEQLIEQRGAYWRQLQRQPRRGEGPRA